MSKSTVAELGTLASVKRKGVISSIHWEGLFFLVIAVLLGFQERFLATDASVVSSNYHFLNLYFKFTSALLSSHKFLAIPFLVFFLYSTFRRAPRRISTNRKSCGHKNAAKEAAAQEYIISAIDEFP